MASLESLTSVDRSQALPPLELFHCLSSNEEIHALSSLWGLSGGQMSVSASCNRLKLRADIKYLLRSRKILLVPTDATLNQVVSRNTWGHLRFTHAIPGAEYDYVVVPIDFRDPLYVWMPNGQQQRRYFHPYERLPHFTSSVHPLLMLHLCRLHSDATAAGYLSPTVLEVARMWSQRLATSALLNQTKYQDSEAPSPESSETSSEDDEDSDVRSGSLETEYITEEEEEEDPKMTTDERIELWRRSEARDPILQRYDQPMRRYMSETVRKPTDVLKACRGGPRWVEDVDAHAQYSSRDWMWLAERQIIDIVMDEN